MTNPKLLILDEATEGLPIVRGDLGGINKLKSETGLSSDWRVKFVIKL